MKLSEMREKTVDELKQFVEERTIMQKQGNVGALPIQLRRSSPGGYMLTEKQAFYLVKEKQHEWTQSLSL